MAYVSKKYTVGTGENLIGVAGQPGFGVGVCPANLLPSGMTGMFGYGNPMSDNYGNYQYQDGSICCWIPKCYYKITAGTDNVDIKGIDTYANEAAANVDDYALHRAFIDGGVEQPGFFIDKYKCSKNAWGTGYIASSIKNGLPISTHADHNPIADLTACDTNAYFEPIDAAHARDGVDGAVNASSIWHCSSKFQIGLLALLSLAHGQASSNTTYCAWYDATYNYPKGCNNDALKDYDEASNGAGSGDDLLYTSDGYDNCGKTGSGVPFAKSTHNGQNCGVADLNSLMYEVNIGMTCIASTMSITGASQDDPCVITVADTSALTTGDWIMIISVVGMTELNSKMYQITVINGTTFSLDDVDSTGYAAWSSAGTIRYGNWYAASESTAMKDFTSGNSGATDHWGATGVAAMMTEMTMSAMPFEANESLAQRHGSGSNQVLDEAVSGDGWILTGLGFPQDSDGIDTTGTNSFGKDYFYSYVRNELCVRSCGYWGNTSSAGIWYSTLNANRAGSSHDVSFRLGLYLV